MCGSFKVQILDGSPAADLDRYHVCPAVVDLINPIELTCNRLCKCNRGEIEEVIDHAEELVVPVHLRRDRDLKKVIDIIAECQCTCAEVTPVGDVEAECVDGFDELENHMLVRIALIANPIHPVCGETTHKRFVPYTKSGRVWPCAGYREVSQHDGIRDVAISCRFSLEALETQHPRSGEKLILIGVGFRCSEGRQWQSDADGKNAKDQEIR